MPTELALERHDKGPIGTFDEVQGMIVEVFPGVRFGWTQSGQDKLKLAAQRGIEFPPALHEALQTLPSLLEGRYRGEGCALEFGLGFEEPVMCLYLTPHGSSPELESKLSQLEAKVGGKFVISGEETNRQTNPGQS